MSTPVGLAVVEHASAVRRLPLDRGSVLAALFRAILTRNNDLPVLCTVRRPQRQLHSLSLVTSELWVSLFSTARTWLQSRVFVHSTSSSPMW